MKILAIRIYGNKWTFISKQENLYETLGNAKPINNASIKHVKFMRYDKMDENSVCHCHQHIHELNFIEHRV